jgi:hypothetical protein
MADYNASTFFLKYKKLKLGYRGSVRRPAQKGVTTMFSKAVKSRVSLLLLLLGLVAVVPAFAGSAVIGSVAGSMNATVGGQALLPNTTLFSGDNLQVRDGVAVVAIGKSSRMVFGHDTVASFLRDSDEVTVLLSQGNVSLFHPDNSGAVRIKAGDVVVAPASGFKTLGEVAMLNGSVVVTAKEGALKVDGNGKTVNVAKGQTINISPKTARAPQGGASAISVSTGTGLGIAAVAAGGIAAVLAGVAMSRAGDAKTNAAAAVTAANNATSAANAAQSTAAAADSDAVAAGATANSVGCALNTFAAADLGFASPYTPPAGYPPC